MSSAVVSSILLTYVYLLINWFISRCQCFPYHQTGAANIPELWRTLLSEKVRRCTKYKGLFPYANALQKESREKNTQHILDFAFCESEVHFKVRCVSVQKHECMHAGDLYPAGPGLCVVQKSAQPAYTTRQCCVSALHLCSCFTESGLMQLSAICQGILLQPPNTPRINLLSVLISQWVNTRRISV